MNTALVNVSKYPLDRPDSVEYREMIDTARKELKEKGLVNFETFLTPETVAHFNHEIDDLMPQVFHRAATENPYGNDGSDEFPQDHPRNIRGPMERYGLSRHQLSDTGMDELYCWPQMRQFIADIMAHDKIYLSADPSNGLVLQIYKEGCGQAWHFDQALFSTIINLGEPKTGGVFECVPDLRTEDNPNYEEVQDVLQNRSSRVQKHIIKSGSFVIMLGRYTLHRLTKIEQDKSRISLILSYELKPGIHMDAATRRTFYGPTAPSLP